MKFYLLLLLAFSLPVYMIYILLKPMYHLDHVRRFRMIHQIKSIQAQYSTTVYTTINLDSSHLPIRPLTSSLLSLSSFSSSTTEGFIVMKMLMYVIIISFCRNSVCLSLLSPTLMDDHIRIY